MLKPSARSGLCPESKVRSLWAFVLATEAAQLGRVEDVDQENAEGQKILSRLNWEASDITR